MRKFSCLDPEHLVLVLEFDGGLQSDSKNHACPLLPGNAKALDSSQVKELDVSIVDLAFTC